MNSANIKQESVRTNTCDKDTDNRQLCSSYNAGKCNRMGLQAGTAVVQPPQECRVVVSTHLGVEGRHLSRVRCSLRGGHISPVSPSPSRHQHVADDLLSLDPCSHWRPNPPGALERPRRISECRLLRGFVITCGDALWSLAISFSELLGKFFFCCARGGHVQQ